MKDTKKIKMLICMALMIVFLFGAFYNGLVVRKYSIHTDKLKVDDTVRVVLIADLHNCIFDKNQNRLISLIQKQEPDLIALAGDIADDEVPIKGTELLLAGIQGLAPVYYVSGNHEFWSNDIENIKATIRKYNVTILENNYEPIHINNVSMIICGVDDPDIVKYEKPDFDWQGEMRKAFAGLQDQLEYKVLLAHRPELIEVYKKNGFDLVLSGHAHGGQVRVPFVINGLLSPNQGWFPKYAGGVYNHDSLTHVVSRGISFNPRLPRIFNPPEIVVIDIQGISQ